MGSWRGGPAWFRWLAVPWSERLLAATLLAAAAVPVFLVASVGVWRSVARDDVTARTVATASPATHGADVAHEVIFESATMGAADAEIRRATGRVPGLGELDRSLYTLPGLLTIGPPVRRVGPSARLFARPGAVDAIEIVERLGQPESGPVPGNGVYVSTWFAERHGLELGDGLAFESGAIVDEEWNDLVAGGGTASLFRIAGLYEPLWATDPAHRLDPYWAGVPAEVVPRFVSVFNGPNVELVVASEETVLASGLSGVARWRAERTSLPTTFDDLLHLRDRMRRFESELVERGPLRDALSAVATGADGRPRLTTEVLATTSTVEAAVRRLDGPLASSQAVGAAVGMLALVAVGAFVVERRRTEFRLLVGEGHGWFRLTGLVGAQLLAPVVLGSACGVAVAVVGLRWFGPASRYQLASVGWSDVVWTAAVAWCVAAAVAGTAGSRVLRERSVPPRVVGYAVVGVLTAAVVVAWLQVGRTSTSAGRDVDLAVIGLPVSAVALAVTVAVAVVGAVVGRAVGDGGRLPLPLFLTLRRLVVGGAGLRVIASAIGLGIGLLVFAVALTSTLDRTVDTKLATVVGGASTLTVLGEPGPGVSYPEQTTLVRTWDTILTPGRVRVRVVAIDPATWPDAVSWPSQFGSDPDSIARRVSTPHDDAVPAVAVLGERTPTRGAFGLTRTYAFDVVERVEALPGAGVNTVTLLISAPILEQTAIDAAGYDSVHAAASDGFVLPTVRFTRRLVSQAPLSELTAAVERADLGFRDASSFAARRRDPDVLAARAAFGYLGVLGVAAAAAAVAGLGLYLGSRRRARALGSVMTSSMGLNPSRSALVTTMEVAIVLVIAVIGALLAVPLVVQRIAPRFDPAPEIPPAIGVVVDWLPLASTALVAIILVSVVVWWSERRNARRPAGEVLRDLG